MDENRKSKKWFPFAKMAEKHGGVPIYINKITWRLSWSMLHRILYLYCIDAYTIKPVLVVTSIRQATCIKQACIQFSKQADTLKCTCIKQAPVLSKQILSVP